MLNYERDIKPILTEIKVKDGLPPEKIRHKFYKKSVEIAEYYHDTFKKEYPKFLDKSRPREKEIHKKYRKDIYDNVLKDFPTKVFTMLESIRQNEDYNIYWPEEQELKQDSLKSYFDKKKIEEWVFKYFVNRFVYDPNAVLFVLPKELTTSDTEYWNPIPQIVNSSGVIKYQENKIAVLLTDETVELLDVASGTYSDEGRVYYFIDTDSFTRCEQVRKLSDGKFEYNIWGMSTFENPEGEILQSFTPILHGYEGLPAWKVGEQLNEFDSNGNELFVSIIDNAIPHLRSAASIYLDMIIERNHHVHSVEWIVAPKKAACKNPLCKDGIIRQSVEDETGGYRYIEDKCTVCNSNDTSLSNLDVIVINPPTIDPSIPLGEAPKLTVTGPPAGYIKRNIEALQTFRKEFDKEYESAFATINAEFLLQSPNSESGTSKSYDRQEYYRLLARVAKHIKNNLDAIIHTINKIRYKGEQKEPNVVVPIDTFDLSREEELWKAITESYQYGCDTEIQKGLEFKYAVKRFGKNSPETKRIELLSRIDSFYFLEENNKLESILLYMNDIQARYEDDDPNKYIQIKKCMWSINAYNWMKKAEAEHRDFLFMPYDQQLEIITRYSDEELPTKLKTIVLGTNGMASINPLVDMKQNDQLRGQ